MCTDLVNVHVGLRERYLDITKSLSNKMRFYNFASENKIIKLRRWRYRSKWKRFSLSGQKCLLSMRTFLQIFHLSCACFCSTFNEFTRKYKGTCFLQIFYNSKWHCIINTHVERNLISPSIRIQLQQSLKTNSCLKVPAGCS